MSKYTYISSIDYINNLGFDYVETYSFQRGTDYEDFIVSVKPEYENLQIRKITHNDLNIFEEERFLELDNLFSRVQYLINDKGYFYPLSIKINTFQASEPIIARLKSILQTEIQDIPNWMCAPVYRDALVFYDKNNRIISTLNICFSCKYMETKNFHHVNADNKTYLLLKQFFCSIGHEIEDDMPRLKPR